MNINFYSHTHAFRSAVTQTELLFCCAQPWPATWCCKCEGCKYTVDFEGSCLVMRNVLLPSQLCHWQLDSQLSPRTIKQHLIIEGVRHSRRPALTFAHLGLQYYGSPAAGDMKSTYYPLFLLYKQNNVLSTHYSSSNERVTGNKSAEEKWDAKCKCFCQ